MKIREIRAFAIRETIAGGIYRQSDDPARPAPRRPPWTKDAEVANPMSRYPRFKALRASWQASYPQVGCVVIAEDGSFGFGTTGYGAPSISLVNDHLGRRLVGENAPSEAISMRAEARAPARTSFRFVPRGTSGYIVPRSLT